MQPFAVELNRESLRANHRNAWVSSRIRLRACNPRSRRGARCLQRRWSIDPPHFPVDGRFISCRVWGSDMSRATGLPPSVMITASPACRLAITAGRSACACSTEMDDMVLFPLSTMSLVSLIIPKLCHETRARSADVPLSPGQNLLATGGADLFAKPPRSSACSPIRPGRLRGFVATSTARPPFPSMRTPHIPRSLFRLSPAFPILVIIPGLIDPHAAGGIHLAR